MNDNTVWFSQIRCLLILVNVAMFVPTSFVLTIPTTKNRCSLLVEFLGMIRPPPLSPCSTAVPEERNATALLS